MLDCLIDIFFVQFGRRGFQQTVGIQMGTNFAPLLANLFLHLGKPFLRTITENRKKFFVTCGAEVSNPSVAPDYSRFVLL